MQRKVNSTNDMTCTSISNSLDLNIWTACRKSYFYLFWEFILVIFGIYVVLLLVKCPYLNWRDSEVVWSRQRIVVERTTSSAISPVEVAVQPEAVHAAAIIQLNKSESEC